MQQISGKVLRVFTDDDGSGKKTIVAIGPADGAPAHQGAVALPFIGAVQGAFAAFTIDPADAGQYPQGASVIVTLAPA